MVSISACHADDPGSIPGRGVLSLILLEFKYNLYVPGLRTGPVAQWIRHRSTEPEIVGSSPTRVILAVFENAKKKNTWVLGEYARALVA